MRIKFFSVNDLASGIEMRNAEKRLKALEKSSYDINEINEILELYNIKLYFDNGMYLKNWSEEQIGMYKKQVKKFEPMMAIFFSKISDDNICGIIEKIECRYEENFWMLFDKYKVYRRISLEIFKEILDLNERQLFYIVHYKEVVSKFDKVIREYMLSYEKKSVELLLDYYFKKDFNGGKTLYFPNSLTSKDKKKMLESYIEKDFGRYNYLELIVKSKSIKEMELDKKIKYKAKKCLENLKRTVFSNKISGFTFVVKCERNQKLSKKTNNRNTNQEQCFEIIYDRTWLEENLDYPTLLNNFIYVFEFVDSQFRFINIRPTNPDFTLMKFLMPEAKGEYTTDLGFEFSQTKVLFDMTLYYSLLNSQNVRLEEILEWFFKDYLLKEFEVENYQVSLPSKDSTYLEKCRSIAAEMENALKQFMLFVEDKKINRELLEISSEQLNYSRIGSLIDKKYIYPKGEIIQKIFTLIFSNQSPIKIIENNCSHRTFTELISEEKVKKEDFFQRNQGIIDKLLEEKIILKSADGYLSFNSKLLWILREFYKKGVLCSSYLNDFKDELKFLEKKEMIEYESSLFSRLEHDYFNYILNSSKFSNGLDLRNKYLHGTQSIEKKIHMNDYLKFLELFVLIVIKINEEFCLYDELKKKKCYNKDTNNNVV